ncbi:hypothetical protein N9A86_02115 [Akkermansiaceae bacterium]|nr:hypothetical protein [Akkermansiaceae bacterium]MDB4537957.1 hypothetical protein [Akkermansiaceae bacterium]
MGSLIFATGLLVGNASATVTVTFGGPKIVSPPQQGLVAHGEINENPIFNQFGISTTHPYDALIGSVYTELTSTDGFDFTTGGELPFTNAPTVGFQASTPAGHGFSTIGVTATDANVLWIASRGFNLDTTVAGDYYFDTATDIEHRIYRDGQFVIYEETGPGVYQEVLAFQNVVTTMAIDWGAIVGGAPDGSITASSIGDGWSGPSGILPLFDLSISTFSQNPIAQDGVTAEGGYAIYPTNSEEWAVVPEPSAFTFLAACLAGFFSRRTRTDRTGYQTTAAGRFLPTEK